MPSGTGEAAKPYAFQGHDAVRSTFEARWFAMLIPWLLSRAGGGGELLDLGCGDAAMARLAGSGLTRYVGVDLAPSPGDPRLLRHDLRDGLGPVGARPFDLYLGTFGIASHLAPAELRRLVREIARHARPGAIVALEALGLFSLEWPRLWGRPLGPPRTIPYRLATEIMVHPWAPRELAEVLRWAGIEPLWARDRTLQAGPKLGEEGYWPGLPSVRPALNALLDGPGTAHDRDELAAALPPLPAGEPALLHHALAARRRALMRRQGASATAIWRLEPPTGGGFGHGLLLVGRVRP
jgi:SAM-dependent methyltransferase